MKKIIITEISDDLYPYIDSRINEIQFAVEIEDNDNETFNMIIEDDFKQINFFSNYIRIIINSHLDNEHLSSFDMLMSDFKDITII